MRGEEEEGGRVGGTKQLQVKVSLPAAHCPPAAAAAAKFPTPKSGVTTPYLTLETM